MSGVLPWWVGWGWGAFNRRVAGRNGQVREEKKKTQIGLKIARILQKLIVEEMTDRGQQIILSNWYCKRFL